MKNLRRAIGIMGVVLLMGGMLTIPPTARAETEAQTCECWCGVPDKGATVDASAKTSGDCQLACQGKSQKMLMCTTNSAQSPSQNVSCFANAKQCETQNGKLDTGYQPPECLPSWHYCYPDPSKRVATDLSISIGGVVKVNDIGDYIAVVYKWMIGAGTTLAIVFVMISGFTMSFSALSADQYKKAKTRMLSSIMGLVLLMGTYLLLSTVNPALLSLQVPKFPLIRQIGLIDANSSCGYLTGYDLNGGNGIQNGYPGSPFVVGGPKPKGGHPYELDEPVTSALACGVVSKVEKDWEGNEVPAGTTCTWDQCSGASKKCFVNSSGGECLSCISIGPNNNFIKPSTEVCGSFAVKKTPVQRPSYARGRLPSYLPYLGQLGTLIQIADNLTSPEAPAKIVDHIQECFWTRDASMLNISNLADSVIGSGTCAELDLDCSKIFECDDYDTEAKVWNLTGMQDLESIRNSGVQSGLIGYTGSLGDKSLATICNADPCGVAREGYSCHGEQPVSRLVGTLSALVNVQGNDCVSVKNGGLILDDLPQAVPINTDAQNSAVDCPQC